MAVKIDDMRSLEDNHYEQLVIKQDKKNSNYFVNVRNSIKVRKSFFSVIRGELSNQMKYCIDDIKIIYIVRHFLKDNIISFVNTSYNFIPGKQIFNKVSGQRASLIFQINNSQHIFNECLKKYIQDRAIFMEYHKNRVLNYEIMAFPGIHSYTFCENHINMRIDSDGIRISDADRIFFKSFLLEKLQLQQEIAEITAPFVIVNHKKVYYEPYCDLICGELKIRLHSEVFREIAQWVVDYYNDMLMEKKKKLEKVRNFNGKFNNGENG